MDIKQLETLVWVARLGSFSKAGERLFLTQPTVSAHISSLEKELGVRLIVRTTKTVTPSPQGERLLVYAEEILRLRDEALTAVSAASRQTDSLCELFRIDPEEKNIISLVGAGGKTTFLFALADELAQRGKRVAVTTTTRIFRPDTLQCLHVVTDGDPGKVDTFLAKNRLVTVGSPADNNKLAAPSQELLDYLYQTADTLLIEADGSRCLPIKVPDTYEPVVPQRTTKVIAVTGLSALGKPLGVICHRAALAQESLQVRPEHLVTNQDVARLILHSYGRFGDMLTVVLNQADSGFLRRQAQEIARMLRQAGTPYVAVSSFLSKQFELCE